MVLPRNTGDQWFERAIRLPAQSQILFPYVHNGDGLSLLVHEHLLITSYDDALYAAGMLTAVRWGKCLYRMQDLM